MSLNYHDIENARRDAQRDLQQADKAVRQAAPLIVNRLRCSGVPGYILDELKKELKGYNMHTSKWSDKG